MKRNSTVRSAIVIGGGIAGPCAALALARAGIEPIVYEAYEEGAAIGVGAWLTVAVNGLDAMRVLGLDDAVKRAGFPSASIELCSGTGRVLGTVPIGGALEDGTVTHTLKRSDLYAIASDEVGRRGLRIEHGKRFVGASVTRDGRVLASFADGSSVEGDLLIGADGLRSRVREVIDPSAPRPRYTGLGNVGGFTRSASVDLAPGTYRMIFGHRCFFGITVSPSGEIWWFANPARRDEPTREELASITTEEWKARLVELASVDQSPLAGVIAATDHPLAFTSQYEMPRVPTWSRGPMIVIGDAAHAASPASGQGASLAAEDAVELARCVRDLPDAATALAEYESLRRARVERVVADGARMGSAKTPGPIGRMARDLVLPWILRRQPGADERAWLFRHHIEWDAPVGTSAASAGRF